jgi:hypothetical protein
MVVNYTLLQPLFRPQIADLVDLSLNSNSVDHFLHHYHPSLTSP